MERSRSAPTVWTIGYEKLQPGPLAAELEAAGVRRVLDVRFRPQSRRPGMSKTRLGAWLREHGMDYEHRRRLGTPPDIRALYRAGWPAEAAEAYRRHVEVTAADELDALADDLLTAAPTALLCLESDPAHCHRRVIADALRARLPGLFVVDL
jgi:uncharacterized protein (DUF488 family)